MADKGKKPLVTPVGAKNIAAAKAAFGGTTAAPAVTTPSKKEEPAKSAPAKKDDTTKATPSPFAKKESDKSNVDPAKDVKAAAKAPSGATNNQPAAQSAQQKPEVKEPSPATPSKPERTATAAPSSRKLPVASDESSSAGSSESESESESDSGASERTEKKKKIDVGVSLSSIKAAFQQDSQQRQQVKKGYDAEEFRKEVKSANAAAGQEEVTENTPETLPADVIRSAVQNDLGLDVLKNKELKSVKSRFEQGVVNENGRDDENDELKALKERSVVSGDKSKWENPSQMISDIVIKHTDPADIEVAASKAQKMREKFEKKVKKEEKKKKTPKPKPRSGDNNNKESSDNAEEQLVAELELVSVKRITYK